MAQKFAKVALRSNEGGVTVNGEFVAESSTAWMVAVDGKVKSYQKNEWTPVAPDASKGFEDVFGGIFGR